MSEPIIQGPGEGELLEAGPTTTVVKVPGEATDGKLGLVEMRIDPGWAGPPPHVHGRVCHVWYVLEGEVQLTIGEESGRHGPGACLLIPAGTPHGFGTPEDRSAVILQVDTPMALDGYFRELTDAFPPGSPVDPELIGEIMRRHDTMPV